MRGSSAADPSVSLLWESLEEEEQNVLLERRKLQEIWLKIADMHTVNEEKRRAFEAEAQLGFVPAPTRVVLNVGGQIFETTAGVLCRDRFSLLAALCRGGGGSAAPVEKDPASGAFFLDRDWWVFRYVLQFLRSGALPDDGALLREMHEEAAFYRLETLRRAIAGRCAQAALLREMHEKAAFYRLDTLRRAIAGRMELALTAQQQRHHCSSESGGQTMLQTSPIRAYGGPSWATTQRDDDAHYLDDYGGSGGAAGGGHWRGGGSGGAQGRTQARTPLPDPFGFT
ncbi:BTB/POZ protein [Tribonema minus]|uniref:BTB/POZ protein n=1 Tax=Tribonema minus TaxID=303371 RepID=A0A835ZHY9_9STRA|nr:BTB/POZ protein [Tribonema minus]